MQRQKSGLVHYEGLCKKPHLEKHPEPLTLLTISSQPYVGYQEAVLTHLFPKTFIIEAIGKEGRRTLPLSVLLDTLGRETVWREK